MLKSANMECGGQFVTLVLAYWMPMLFAGSWDFHLSVIYFKLNNYSYIYIFKVLAGEKKGVAELVYLL